MTDSSSPTLAQRFGYYYLGRTLPESMRDWVQNDLIGPGAVARYLLRFIIPVIPVLCLFLLIPGPLWIGLSMMALLLFPLIFFRIALIYVYRRNRLGRHGLDPALADAKSKPWTDTERDDYERRHGRG